MTKVGEVKCMLVVKEGPVVPKLKEVIKDISKLLSYHLEKRFPTFFNSGPT